MIGRGRAEQAAGFLVEVQGIAARQFDARLERDQPADQAVEAHSLLAIRARAAQRQQHLLEPRRAPRDVVDRELRADSGHPDFLRSEIGVDVSGIVLTHAELEEQVFLRVIVHDRGPGRRQVAATGRHGAHRCQQEYFLSHGLHPTLNCHS